ncbi:MAG: aminoglycoside phosphotransferase family protein [Gemmatimonadota bacterium]|nr:aminoglycoside phosphotransferase family protein [Gemmatimonadota bacterium]
MTSPKSPLSPRLQDLIKSIDNSPVVSVARVKDERDDLLVTCKSGRRHLLRIEDGPIPLLRQKWAYEQLRQGGVPCPRVEATIEPDSDVPNGCLLISWIEAVPSSEIIRREGQGEKSHALCRELGRALRRLHHVNVAGPVPDFIFKHTRAGAYQRMEDFVGQLREAELIDKDFEGRYRRLFEKYAATIPAELTTTLCFTDTHFSNIIVYDRPNPGVAGFVDMEEIGVGWPMWDFTNWECWGMRFGLSWTRDHILEGYGEIDMEMYRFALLVRLSRPFTFVGSTREQIIRAVESEDIGNFKLERLYQ